SDTFCRNSFSPLSVRSFKPCMGPPRGVPVEQEPAMPVNGRDRSFGLTTPRKLHSSVEHAAWDNDHYFHDLPDPTWEAPFRMDLRDVLADSEIDQIKTT